MKRPCKTKTGKIGYKGYMYKYSISSQGWKYLTYLANPNKENKDMKGLEDLMVLKWIERNLPKDRQDIAWLLYKSLLSDRKGFKGFTTSKEKFYEKLIEYRWKLTRDEEIAVLERKTKKLEEENRMLREKVKEDVSRVWENPKRGLGASSVRPTEQ